MKVDKQSAAIIGLVSGLVILIFGFMFTSLNSLSTQMYEMNRTIGELKSDNKAISSRMDRVSDALPASMKLAMEQVAKPIEAALITTDPFQDASGHLKASVALIDFTKGECTAYLVALKDYNDLMAAYLAKAIVPSYTSANAASFTELARFSLDVGKVAYAPSNIDAEASFALYKKDSAEYRKVSKDLVLVVKVFAPTANVVTATVPAKVVPWDNLAGELAGGYPAGCK